MRKSFFKHPLYLTLLLVFLFSEENGKALAQELPKLSLEAISAVEETIEIDGLLNEPVWQIGKPARQFIQQEPNVGELAQVETFVRLSFDDKNIYIAALLNDPNSDLVQGDERQRDALLERSDAFAVLIDTYHDHQNGFFFETNPLSAMSDALVSQEGTEVNRDWDGNWEVSAQRTATGWSVEFRIPFETLRFRQGDSQTWGIQFRRRVPHLKEISFWNPISIEQTLFEVSRAGHLIGIKTTETVRPLFIKPYAKASYDSERDEDADAGIDLRYRFRTDLTLDLTYNTDFAETEVDRFQVNLTQFSLFFPEKREFFLEGKGFYEFGLPRRVQPYFSRRIGLEKGDRIPIFLGGKLSGKLGPYGIGALVMETEAKGELPEERFGVLRISRDIGLRSNLGLIGTKRDEEGGPSNEAFGFDTTIAPHPNLSADGFWVRSDDEESKEKGAAYFGEVEWRDPFWRIKLNHLLVEDTFLPALGFVRRGNLKETFGFEETFGYIDIRPQPKTGRIREIGLKTEMTYQRDANGDFLYQSNYNRILVDFRSGDFILISIDPQRERVPDDNTLQGIRIPKGIYHYTDTNIILLSDTSRSLSGEFDLLWGGLYNGRRTSLDLSLTAAPAEGIKLGAGLEMDWLRLPQGNFTGQILNGEIDWSMSNALLIQGLVQWDDPGKLLAGNIRFSWEYRKDSRLFLIINPTRQDHDDTLVILTKITWLWEPL